MTAAAHPAERSLADRLGLIIDPLCTLCFVRMGTGSPLYALMSLLHRRLRTAQRRFLQLLALMHEGQLPAPRPPRSTPPPLATPAVRAKSIYPRGFAWLCVLIPQWAPGYGCQLNALLGEPEAQALLAAAPQLVRELRPILRMLGQDHVSGHPPPPRRPRAPKPPPDPSVPRPLSLSRLRRLILSGRTVPRDLVLPPRPAQAPSPSDGALEQPT